MVDEPTVAIVGLPRFRLPNVIEVGASSSAWWRRRTVGLAVMPAARSPEPRTDEASYPLGQRRGDEWALLGEGPPFAVGVRSIAHVGWEGTP